MLQNFNLLAADWSLGINVTITGIVVVFSMLVLLVIVLSTFGLFFGKGQKKEKAAPIKVENKATAAPKAVTSVQPVNNGAVSDEIVAVIAAAVASMYEGTDVVPVIRRIKKSDRKTRPAWTSAGIFENTRSF